MGILRGLIERSVSLAGQQLAMLLLLLLQWRLIMMIILTLINALLFFYYFTRDPYSLKSIFLNRSRIERHPQSIATPRA